MSEPLVSIILATYKREPAMVKRAIDSAINQTYANIELLIIDDSPSNYVERDSVRLMIEGIRDKRIKYIQHPVNRGACAARNTGIIMANGDYIIYFDDDDELMPKNIERRIVKFTDYRVGLVYCSNIIVDENIGVERIVRRKMVNGMVFEHLIEDNIVGAFPILRKECFDTCGLFDENMQAAQDYEMWLRIAQKYEFDYVDEPLSKVYLHSGERITTTLHKKIQGLEEINRRHEIYLDKHRNIKNIRLMKLVHYYACNGDIRKAKKTWVAAFKLAPFKLYTNTKYLYQLYKDIKRYKK